MHRPASVVDRGRWSPAGVFYAFSAPHVHAESPENRRDRDAGDILVACLFARIARANPPATVHIPRRVSPTVVIGVMPSARECAGYFLDHLTRRAGRRRGGPPRLGPRRGNSHGFIAGGVERGVRLGAPVDPMVEEYLMAHYARAFEARVARRRVPERRRVRGPRRVWKIRMRRRGGRGWIGSRARGRADPGQRRGAPTEGFSSPC